MIAAIPVAASMPTSFASKKVNDKDLLQTVAILDSMTKRERRFPDLINGSRKHRIAEGSGTDIQKINRTLKQYEQMQKMMKKMGGKSLMRMAQTLKGKLPPVMGASGMFGG